MDIEDTGSTVLNKSMLPHKWLDITESISYICTLLTTAFIADDLIDTVMLFLHWFSSIIAIITMFLFNGAALTFLSVTVLMVQLGVVCMRMVLVKGAGMGPQL